VSSDGGYQSVPQAFVGEILVRMETDNRPVVGTMLLLLTGGKPDSQI
jgi:hypothetical protein